MSDSTRSICLECGAWGPVNEYHPFAYCMLVKAIGQESARANIDDVVAYGRKLERAHLSAEGMAVVPVEPTEKMLASAAFCDRGSGRRRTITDILTAEYKAMLSASPYGKASMQEASAERAARSEQIPPGKEESK